MTEATHTPQRRSERKPAQIAVTLVIEGDEADEIATALDLSQPGMKLQTEISLKAGQRVGFLLSDDPSCVLGARVVWASRVDSGQGGQAGLELLKPIAEPV